MASNLIKQRNDKSEISITQWKQSQDRSIDNSFVKSSIEKKPITISFGNKADLKSALIFSTESIARQEN
mgnify:CR=1 FL=1